MSDSKLKILLFGRIGDEVEAFVAKLTALNSSKAGPFDAAFCVGSANVKLLGELALPTRVYIQDPLQDVESLVTPSKSDSSKEEESSDYPCVRLSEALYILRNPKPPHAASVWSLSVSDNAKKPELVVVACPSHWRMDEKTPAVADLLQKISHVSYTGCDLLLTTEWPQGVESTIDQQQVQVDSHSLSFDIAQVALRARARYHVAVGTKFGQSHPYAHIAAMTNTQACHHAGRFLSMAPVVDAEGWKQVTDKKKSKFVHALGLQPLHSMSFAEIQAQKPATGLKPCPFTDQSYPVDEGPPDQYRTATNANASMAKPSSGLSEAQARRILSEERSKGGGGHRFGQKEKRGRDEPEEVDPTNLTIFVHGLHKDVTGVLQSSRGDSMLLQAFARFGATAVRKPPNAETSSFAFIDFPSHEKALVCWTDLKGGYTVGGVDLAVKWATSKRKASGEGDGQPFQKRRRLTEAEARDSNTVFFSMGPNFRLDTEENTLEASSEKLRVWMEETLEEALAGDDGERVKAADEPALQVQKRLASDPSDEKNFGFLEFASHAAASMALATLTGSTDGGIILADAPGSPGKEYEHVRLHWGLPKQNAKEKEFVEDAETGFKFERKHFPADARKDCWFCLASDSCEKHLITGVYNQCYSAMPKGPIHDGHVLLVPVQHTSEGALKDARLSEEMDEIKKGLREHASKVYDMELFVFERAMQTKGGYHTHVQCIPVPRQRGPEIRATMIAQGRSAGADIRELTSDLGLSAVLGNSEESYDGYFYAEVPVSESENRRFLYKSTKGTSLPLQFGREIVATVLRKPELAHWKSCMLDKETEVATSAKLRESLEQHMG